MSDIQFWAAIIAFITNIIILITQVIQVYKLKKELRDVKIVINNTEDLREALKKPLEGMWEVRGVYTKFHNDIANYNSSGYVNFCWDDLHKKYDVYYVYSVRKEHATIDLVTSICSGIAIYNESIKKNNKITMQMKIDARCSNDNFNNSSKTFEYISNKIIKIDNRINKIEFIFSNSNVEGTISFVR